MSRPGFTLEADERTSTTLVVRGTTPSLQRLAPGTQVVYPPDPGEWSDPTPLIEAALDQPVDRFLAFHSLSPWRSSTRV